MSNIQFRAQRVDNGELAIGYYWMNHEGTHYITYLGYDDFFNVEVIYETVEVRAEPYSWKSLKEAKII